MRLRLQAALRVVVGDFFPLNSRSISRSQPEAQRSPAPLSSTSRAPIELSALPCTSRQPARRTRDVPPAASGRTARSNRFVRARACGSDNKSNAASADGDKTSFCAINAEINAGTKGATSADEFVTELSPFEPKLDTFLAHAPAAIKADAQTLVETSHTALSDNNGDAFAADAVVLAGKNVDAFCGVSV